MRRSVTLGFAAMALVAAAGAAVAADSLRWTLGFRNDAPSWVLVPAGGGKTKVAWVMGWTVTNKTGAKREPEVRVEILGPKDRTFADTLDPLSLAAARRKWGVKELSLTTDLRKGVADGATVNGVSTFGALDDHAKEFELRVHGLRDPLDLVDGKTFHEKSYWSVKYTRRGDEFRRSEDPWKQVSSGWVVVSRDELPGIPK
jgi:hypothetical protein